jgi:hypothetical protein
MRITPEDVYLTEKRRACAIVQIGSSITLIAPVILRIGLSIVKGKEAKIYEDFFLIFPSTSGPSWTL